MTHISPTMQLTPDQTRAIRLFEKANLVCAFLMLLGAVITGFGHLVPGGLVGAAAAALNIRLSRRIVQRFLQSEPRNKLSASRQLSFKAFCVLACVGGVVYLRPELAAGVALGFTSILPASLVLAVGYISSRLE